ncbi:Gfo/Idh/MocA family protein [Persicitalea jodogahamensis]|uniref:NADH-dependent dehydrogenase n=1 Tax=Persicitalea jodogahamensis TaxID=402147 RepID=A0A8J3DBI1_9BACT|nr:Gfo/Idh/MocA family oxidoreductase [Persicitalea jodogahamensis]GHB80221.1 NADH-dependent dehydrogenase [Persicitalea jodogahamensis]
MTKVLKGVCVGAGYFAQFHYEAWQRIPEVEIVALADTDTSVAKAVATKFGIHNVYPEFAEMLRIERPDFVDIITPPATHLTFCKIAADLGVNIIVQKPLAPTYQEAEELVNYCEAKGVRLMVHENFRFQPWHREIKKLLDDQSIGELFSLNFRMRMGDGWQPDAYLARQPYFRTMPRLLIYETGIHFIDTFRFLAGEVETVYARLRKLNKDIEGEDDGMVFFTFESGASGVYDANRYNESKSVNARYTFGEFLLEGSGGSIRLYNDGGLTLQLLGESEKSHNYVHQNHNFAGDCVFTTQTHFTGCMLSGLEFETSGREYLKNIIVQEAIYESSSNQKVIHMA